MVNTVDGARLRDMVIGAATLLESNKDALNALNVFPVPDGDTGTNMSLTMLAAAKEVSAVDKNSFSDVVRALSMGALKGARGNSGVILSQIWRGFCDVLKNETSDFDTHVFSDAIANGVDCAYKAIMKPKEGTILTVAKALSDSAKKCVSMRMPLETMISSMVDDAEEVLKKTPDMLPVLKEAGVVDAGGAGLLIIFKGFKMVIEGEDFKTIEALDVQKDISVEKSAVNEDIEFGYCTEFFIKNLFEYIEERDIESFRVNISKLGDCVLVVGDLNLVKVHIHTNDPGIVLQTALTMGMLSQIKIDNMREQHRELSDIAPEIPQTAKKPMAIVSVVSGEGLKQAFADCDVDTFVEGGQTMNPSADDILKAIEQAPSDNVFVLPNNKNIVMAAEQAAKLSTKNVVVIKSKTLPQGLNAVLNYNCTDSFDENQQRMQEAITQIKTGQVTYAVRDTSVNGIAIKEGQKIGIGEGEILANGDDINDVSVKLLQSLCDDNCSVIAMYYGEDITENDAELLKEQLETCFDWCDIELSYGGQSVYSYIFSVE